MSAPRFVEDTFRSILLEELTKRGVGAVGPISYQTEVGRLAPDALLENGGNYLVEAKLGDETKLAEALADLHDYTKYIESTGAFAVVYPKNLKKIMPIDKIRGIVFSPETKYVSMAVFNDARTTDRYYGNFAGLVGWIAEHVLRPPKKVPVDVDFLVRMLQRQVEYLTASFTHLTAKDLEGFFGGKDVFESILPYEKGRYPLSHMRKAAAYLLLNQLLFYHVLSQSDPETFIPIDENKIKRPTDFNDYFKQALARNYTAIFSFDVAKGLRIKATNSLKKVSKGIKALKLERISQDLLGKVFHNLIPLDTRKKVAAFYTNNNAAEILAHLCVETPEDHVMDTACGSGTLLVAAYRRKRFLLEETGKKFNQEWHEKFLGSDLTGIDIMPFAAHLAAIHLSLQAPLYKVRKVRIAVWDSTELQPGEVIPVLSKGLREVYKNITLDVLLDRIAPLTEQELYVTKGALTLNKVGGLEEIPLSQVDLVIMNPPFTRQESLPEKYKETLDKRFEGYAKYARGQIGLYGYFIFLADSFLKPNGRLALVLPATILRVRSAEGLRQFLADNYDVEYIITAWQKLAFSEAAWFREILLVARKRESSMQKSNQPCAIITLKRLPRDLEEAAECALAIRTARMSRETDNEWLKCEFINQEELARQSANWFGYIALFDDRIEAIWKRISSLYRNRFVTVSDYLQRTKAEVIRGIETRSTEELQVKSMYVLRDESHAIRPDEAWILKELRQRVIVAESRFSHKSITIPNRCMQEAIRSQSGLQRMDLAADFDYVIANVFDGIEEMLPGLTSRELVEKLESWKSYVSQRCGNLLISRRFVMGVPGTVHLCYYSDTPFTGPGIAWDMKGIPLEEAKLITIWMNSSFNLAQILVNKIHDVWIDFHKYVLLNMLLLDPVKLSNECKERLLRKFEQVRMQKFPSLHEQFFQSYPLRKEIDVEILKCLGFTEDEGAQVLSELYDALSQEMQKIQQLMPSAEEISEETEE